MRLAAVGALAATLAASTGAEYKKVEPQNVKEVQVEPKHNAKQTERKLVYADSADNNTEVNVKVGDGIIFKTKAYPLVPRYLDGKASIKIDGDRILEPLPNVFSSFGAKDEGASVRNIFAFAHSKGKAHATITFTDSNGKKTEETKYVVTVK